MSRALWTVAISLFLLSCNKPTSRAPEAEAGRAEVQAAKIYPHSDEFIKKEHGGFFIQDRALCQNCHGNNLKGGNSQVSCTKCHSGYPHAGDWAVPANHGANYIGSNEADKAWCAKCHTAEKKTGAATCATCHKAYPHSEDFKFGGDGHPDLAKTYDGKCTICHTDFSRNMPSVSSCTSCHEDALKLKCIWPPPPEGTPAPSSMKSDKKVNRATASKSQAKKKHK